MTSVSTHILDTSAGRPAEGVPLTLSVRPGPDAPWTPHAASVTGADGRCTDLPALPEATAHVRLHFDVRSYFAPDAPDTRDDPDVKDAPEAPGRDAPRTEHDPGDGGAFFPEVAVVFGVTPGEHYHVPLLLNPFGYSVYRGS